MCYFQGFSSIFNTSAGLQAVRKIAKQSQSSFAKRSSSCLQKGGGTPRQLRSVCNFGPLWLEAGQSQNADFAQTRLSGRECKSLRGPSGGDSDGRGIPCITESKSTSRTDSFLAYVKTADIWNLASKYTPTVCGMFP